VEREKKIGDLYKKTMRAGGDKRPEESFPRIPRPAGKKKEKPPAPEANPRAAVFPKISSGKTPPVSVEAAAPAPNKAWEEEARAAQPDREAPGLLKLTGKKETSVRKAAKFLMLIGKDEAAKVMRHFTPEEARRLFPVQGKE
jgi:hypothetical protein